MNKTMIVTKADKGNVYTGAKCLSYNFTTIIYISNYLVLCNTGAKCLSYNFTIIIYISN